MVRVRISGGKVSHELKLEFPSVFSASCMPASTTGDHPGTRFILTSSKVGYISLSLKNKKLITWKKIEDSVIGFSKSSYHFVRMKIISSVKGSISMLEKLVTNLHNWGVFKVF